MQKRGASVASLLTSLHARRATLPPEIGSFAVLEVVETLRKTRLALVDAASVLISDEGQVSVSAQPTLDERAAVRSACALLAAVLSAAGRPPSAQLQRLAAGAEGDGVMTLAALRDDLEASLVPLNRQASRRVLARMVREMEWQSTPPVADDKGLDLDDLDGELHRLLDGLELPASAAAPASAASPSAASPSVTSSSALAASSVQPRQADSAARLRSTAWGSAEKASPAAPASEPPSSLEILLGAAEQPPRAAAREPALREPAVAREPATREPAVAREPALVREYASPTLEFAPPAPLTAVEQPVAREPTARTVVDRDREPARMAMPLGAGVSQARVDAARPRTFTSEAPPASSGRGVWVGLGFGALALLLVGTAFWLRPDLRARLDGTVEIVGHTPPAVPQPVVAHGGDLVVHVSLDRAQILRFVGRGPSVIRNVAVGQAHEFVATNDGFAPARVVLPKDAEWESADGVLRNEIALQLTPLAAGASANDGDSLMPRDVGAASGQRGELRVVTTPKGAKIFELVGFAPEARIADVAIDQVHEFLIVRPGYGPVVRVISASDFVLENGRQHAEISVDLAPLPASK